MVIIPSCLDLIFLQTRTKSFKNILNCCKLKVIFENKTRLGYTFDLKYCIPKDLTSAVIYKF